MPADLVKIGRPVLVRYAMLLGPTSIAGQALAKFDALREEGANPVIHQRNNGFRVEAGDERFLFG